MMMFLASSTVPTNAAAIGTVVLAGLALIGILGGAIAWFYRRGGQERELILAMRENSATTASLTSRMDSFMEHYSREHNALDKRVDNHEVRITINEGAIRDFASLQKQRSPWQRMEEGPVQS